jgi:hypothetical protein
MAIFSSFGAHRVLFRMVMPGRERGDHSRAPLFVLLWSITERMQGRGMRMTSPPVAGDAVGGQINVDEGVQGLCAGRKPPS